MKYPVTLKQLMDGAFYARCPTGPSGVVERTGDTEEKVLEALRNQIRYELEWCPCSGVADDYVELVVQRENGFRR